MLVRFALRVCAVEALKGNTIVGENVRNSRIGAIDIAADQSLRINEDRPFVDVFTDDSEASDTDLRDLRQNGALRLNFESGIASPMTETNDAGVSQIIGVGIPATDDALELTLDMIDSQVMTALANPDNEWAEIWRKLSDGVVKIKRRRISSDEGNGPRRAARQSSLTLMAKPDPVYGQPLTETSVWARFKAMVDEHLPEFSGAVDTMLGVPGAAVTPAILQRSRGNTAAEARALGYAPVYPSKPDAIVQGTTLEQDHD